MAILTDGRWRARCMFAIRNSVAVPRHGFLCFFCSDCVFFAITRWYPLLARRKHDKSCNSPILEKNKSEGERERMQNHGKRMAFGEDSQVPLTVSKGMWKQMGWLEHLTTLQPENFSWKFRIFVALETIYDSAAHTKEICSEHVHAILIPLQQLQTLNLHLVFAQLSGGFWTTLKVAQFLGVVIKARRLTAT